MYIVIFKIKSQFAESCYIFYKLEHGICKSIL